MIIDFLVEDQVPVNEKEADRVHFGVARYWLSVD